MPIPTFRFFNNLRGLSATLVFMLLLGCEDKTDISTSLAEPEQHVADAIYYNGNIYTVDEQQPWVNAIAIKAGRYIKVSDDQNVLSMQGPDTKLVDLMGKMIMPGIHDGHVHLLLAGLANNHWCRLPTGSDWSTASQALQDCANNLAPNQWLIAFPYYPEWFKNGFHKSILDSVINDRPVYIHRWDAHIGIVNSNGLALALDKGTENTFAGGRLVRDAANNPTGELVEGATWMAARHFPELSDEELAEAIGWSIKTANRFGITSVQEASATRPLLETLHKLDQRGELTVRVAAHIVWWNENFGNASKSEMEALIEDRAKFQSPHLSTDFVKLWLDGTPIEPNPSTVELDPENNSPQYNMAFINQQTLTDAIVRFDKMGLQVKMHAAAAGASRMVLDTIEQLRTANPNSSLRHQLVHSSDIAPADRKRLASLDVTADMSPDVWSWDKHGDSFPMKDLVETGALVTLGSDWPFPNISHSHPFRYLAEAIDRSTQGIDIESGIRMMTINGARAVGDEMNTGSIKVGKQADFIVLDRNILDSTIKEIENTNVLMTVFSGNVIYQSGFNSTQQHQP